MHVPHTRHSPPPQSPLALAKTTHVPPSHWRRPLAPPPSWTTRASDTRCRALWTSTCIHTQKTGPGRPCTKPTPRSWGEQVSNGLAHYDGVVLRGLVFWPSASCHTLPVFCLCTTLTHAHAFAVVPWPFPYRRVEKAERRGGRQHGFRRLPSFWFAWPIRFTSASHPCFLQQAPHTTHRTHAVVARTIRHH